MTIPHNYCRAIA